MQENSKLNFLSNFLKEQLDSRLNRLENRNINEQKDLKLISTEIEKLKTILKDCGKKAEIAFSKKASTEQSEILNKSSRNIVNISNISSHHDDKNKKLGNETSRRKILTRNATEANIIDSHREKKLDPKDRMTPFKRKTINTEEINKTQGNLTTRLDDKNAPKTPKGKRSIMDLNKINKDDKNEGNITERLKVPSTAKALTRNKTTANFNTSRKPKEDEERPKDSDKTVNQSMHKGKKENLQTIPETKNLTKQPTTKKIETARKEKPELTKHSTEALIKSNTKAQLNKLDKDSKIKDTNFNTNASTKIINGKLKGKIENKDIKIENEYKTNQDIKKDLFNASNKSNEDEGNKLSEDNIEINKHLPNGDAKNEENIVKEKQKIKYLEKIKNDLWKNNIIEFLDYKGEDKNIFKLCKKFQKFFFEKCLQKLEGEITSIKTKISNLKEKYKEEDLTKESPKFVMTRGAIKAVELLNDKMYMQLFNPEVIPIQEVLNIYRILLYYINKADIAKIKSPNNFWQEVCNLFGNNSEGKIGSFINKYSSDLNFSTENIFAISQIIGNDLSKMTAPSYTKICPTTGLVFFFIKDALEYSGIIVDKKTPLIKLMNLLEYNLEYYSSKIDRLQGKVEKIENKNEIKAE